VNRIVVRPAATTDEGALAAIRSDAAASFVDARRRPEDLRPERDRFPHRLDIPHGDDYFCLVALDGTTVVGYVSAGGGRDPDRKSFAEIYEIAVDPTVRRRGVGTRLLEAALRLLHDASYGGVTMWVLESDAAAAALLSRAGFAPDGARTPDDATGADACRYAIEP